MPTVGDIANERGDVVVGFTPGSTEGTMDVVTRSIGFASIHDDEQLARAEGFGWSLFGRNVLDPRKKTVFRGSALPSHARPFEDELG